MTERSDSGRVERIQLGSVLLSGRDLREVLGGRALRSAMFEVRVEDGRAHFMGSGSGHGVGLCQWGASELARPRRELPPDPGTLLPRHGPAPPARTGRPQRLERAPVKTQAETEAPSSPEPAPSNGPGGIFGSPLFLMLPMVLLLWAFMIRPQQRRDKELKEMLSKVEKGDSDRHDGRPARAGHGRDRRRARPWRSPPTCG